MSKELNNLGIIRKTKRGEERKKIVPRDLLKVSLAKELGGKLCTLCMEHLTPESFACSVNSPDGRYYSCRSCTRIRNEERKDRIGIKNSRLYQKNREQYLRQSIVYAQKNPEKMLHSFARNRARKLNVPFDLAPEDIVIPVSCPCLGITLGSNLGVKGRAKPESPNIDRIIPALGYVRGNVQVISHKANVMKGNHSIEDLKRFARWILESM